MDFKCYGRSISLKTAYFVTFETTVNLRPSLPVLIQIDLIYFLLLIIVLKRKIEKFAIQSAPLIGDDQVTTKQSSQEPLSVEPADYS